MIPPMPTITPGFLPPPAYGLICVGLVTMFVEKERRGLRIKV
jgi:hypothetical protein